MHGSQGEMETLKLCLMEVELKAIRQRLAEMEIQSFACGRSISAQNARAAMVQGRAVAGLKPRK